MSIIEAVAAFAKSEYPPETVPHIHEVLHYCDRFVKETGADREVLFLAAYLHDITISGHGWEGHDIKSAEVARQFLGERGYPPEKTAKVAAAIMAHKAPRSGAEAEKMSIEEKLLYDTDKLARAMGLGVAIRLVDLGREAPGGKPTFTQMADVVEAAKKELEETYKSLYTNTARNFASRAHQNARAFCDSLRALERLRSDFASW